MPAATSACTSEPGDSASPSASATGASTPTRGPTRNGPQLQCRVGRLRRMGVDRRARPLLAALGGTRLASLHSRALGAHRLRTSHGLPMSPGAISPTITEAGRTPRYGWVWVPGYTYVSANVTWVRGGAYVGWYARPPHGWSHSARAFHHGYHNTAIEMVGTMPDTAPTSGGNTSARTMFPVTRSPTPSLRRPVSATVAPCQRNDELWRNGRSKARPSRVSTRTVRMDGREVTLSVPKGARPASNDTPGQPSATLFQNPPAGSGNLGPTARQSSGPKRPTATAESALPAIQEHPTRGSHPLPSTARRTQSKRTLRRPDSRAPPSQSKSRSTTVGRETSHGLGRAGRTLGARISRPDDPLRAGRPAPNAPAAPRYRFAQEQIAERKKRRQTVRRPRNAPSAPRARSKKIDD